MSKIEAIKQELAELRDGESFTGVMTISEARIAVAGFMELVDDREFELHQEGHQITILCKFSEKSKRNDRTTLIVSGLILLSIAAHVYFNY